MSIMWLLVFGAVLFLSIIFLTALILVSAIYGKYRFTDILVKITAFFYVMLISTLISLIGFGLFDLFNIFQEL
jgi:hypothetical protein